MSYNTHTEKLGQRDVMKRILLIMRILSTICNFRMIKNAFVNKRVYHTVQLPTIAYI